MPTFSVTIPVTGLICVEVEAASEDEAIQKAFEMELSRDDIEEWDTHREIVRGNVFYGTQNKAEATQISDDED